MTAAIVNTIFNLMVAGAVLVGSFERERLARLQAITSDELAHSNAQLRASRIEAVKARDTAIMANRSKSHFLANMSHELRTPLNAILGFSDMIKSEMFGPVNEPRYRDYIGHIHSSGTLLQSNIDDLLDLARLESGKFGWEDANFDLNIMVGSAVATCEINAQDAGVALSHIGDSPDAMGHADEARLKQAVINLITNALKFTDEGGSVEVSTTITADGSYVVQVRDTGCGMSSEDLQRVRTPFAQAHGDSYSKGKGGLGLGLAIVSGIMERVDGRFDLDSTEGVGTTACLILPKKRILRDGAKVA
jgi:signal transduction histidine kinase